MNCLACVKIHVSDSDKISLCGLSYLICGTLPVAQLVEALRYKPEGRAGTIPDGVTGISH